MSHLCRHWGNPNGEKMQGERKVGSWVPESPKDESMTGSTDDNTEWGRMGHNLESWSVFQFIGREFWVLQKGQRG